jgi:tRNA pseudouridine13 synthase
MDFAMNGEGAVETSVGISIYANLAHGFQGIVKQRYSDFIVREVGLDGNCSALENISPTALENQHFNQNKEILSEVENSSNEQLVTKVIIEMAAITGGVFGEGIKVQVVASDHATSTLNEMESSEESLRNFLFSCLEKSDDCAINITACPCPDKPSRTKLHGIIRKYFSSSIESEALEVDGAKFIRLIAKHKMARGQSGDWRSKNKWPENLEDYLQFTLFKENIDTMSAAHVISKLLATRVDNIQFAGTKDKRAITSQKVTMYRRKPSDLARLNRFNLPPFIRVGDFEYVKEPLKLGSLSGNNFGIIMRDIDSSSEVIESACEAMNQSGFINYFGLQRFGSGGTKSHISGLALFKQDWKLAVEMLFTPREGDKPEVMDLKAAFLEKDYKKALGLVPYKMPSERAVLESLIRKPEDYAGAYNRLSKNQWLICLHAYQSYIWNMVASERTRKYGLICVEGDLIAVGGKVPESEINFENEAEGGEGLPNIEDNTHGADVKEKGDVLEEKNQDNSFQNSKNKKSDIRVLTAEDITSKKYTIQDVILPLPGHDVILPSNDIGSYFLDLLTKDGLSLEFFAKCYPQHRMNGAYRRLLQIPVDFHWNFFEYSDPNEELVPTESSYLKQVGSDKSKRRNENVKIPREFSNESKPFALTDLRGHNHADVPGKYGPGDDTEYIQEEVVKKSELKLKGLQLKFTLPPGTYATMLLREITKHSTHSQYQTQLTATAAAVVVASKKDSEEIGDLTEKPAKKSRVV